MKIRKAKKEDISICISIALESFNFSRGLMKGNEVIASKTEKEIFKELGMNYIKPEDRK